MTDSPDGAGIRELLDRYVEITDAMDPPAWADLFVEGEGELHVFDRVFKGRERLERFLSRAATGRHECFDVEIEIEEPGARARTRAGFRFEADDPEFHSRGNYLDDVVKTADGWRFAVRRIEFDARGPDALSDAGG